MILYMKRMKTSNKEYCNSFKGVPILIDCFQVDANMRSKRSTLPFLCCRHSVRHCRTPSRNHQSRRPWSCLLGPHSSDALYAMLIVFAHVHRRTNVHVEKTPGRNSWMVGVWEYDICVCVLTQYFFWEDVFGDPPDPSSYSSMLLGQWCFSAQALVPSQKDRSMSLQSWTRKSWEMLIFRQIHYLAWEPKEYTEYLLYKLILCLSFEHHGLLYWTSWFIVLKFCLAIQCRASGSFGTFWFNGFHGIDGCAFGTSAAEFCAGDESKGWKIRRGLFHMFASGLSPYIYIS